MDTEDTIVIEKVNEAWIKVFADRSIMHEMYDYFSFFVKDYKYMPKFKSGIWDGKLRLLNLRNRQLYSGLFADVLKFAKSRQYEVVIDDNLKLDYEPHTLDIDKFIGKLKLPFEPFDYQAEAFNQILNLKKILILSPTSCHTPTDKLVMSDLTIKEIQDVEIGEYVIGADGNNKEVLKTFKGEDDLYEIIPNGNAQSITVTGNHILPLKFTKEGKKYDKHGTIENIRVVDYIEKSNWYKHISKLWYNNIPIEGIYQPTCELSPYFIGCYLGDGSTHRCQVTNIDLEIISEVYDVANKLKCEVGVEGISYNITGKIDNRNIIFNEFDKIGIKFGNFPDRIKCHERFIPECCISNTIEYRLELLAGLIDSDGCISSSKTYYDFCVKSELLAKGAARISTSLGLRVRNSTKNVNGVDYYRVYIGGNIDIIPCRIPRKSNIKKSSRNQYISGFDINPIGSGRFAGIQVEDSLYLHENGMVVHNSGKSLIAYMSVAYALAKGMKALIIVPTTTLVDQLYDDFGDYGSKFQGHIHKIYGGSEKTNDANVVITTWQSAFKLDKEWFDPFDMVIVDECHTATANSIKGIMEKCHNTLYRIGMTGTLEDTKTSKFVLKGLFGKVFETVKTKELSDREITAKINIECLMLKYPPETCKLTSKFDYQQEVDFMLAHERRNKFVVNLACSKDKNMLVLFRFVSKHGKPLFEAIKKKAPDKNVFYIDKDTKTEERTRIKKFMEVNSDCILVASYGTFATGISVKNLHYLIFAFAYKSRIKSRQAIGRLLRRSETNDVVLYDICDNLKHKSHENILYGHFLDRIAEYEKEGFDYKIKELKI